MFELTGSIAKFNLVFLLITGILKEELMGWRPSGVRRARIRVIEVNFSEFLIKGNGI